MKMNELGRTGIQVSELCLGSMTWGSQNTTDEGHAQIDMALDHGVNFIDTAEMYPVLPIKAERCGASETVIGEWIVKTGRRNDFVLATKVAGPNPGFLRGGKGYDGPTIDETIDNSLARLQTDFIDLYQLHWPVRGSYMFRQNWTYDPSSQNRDDTIAHMTDVLQALGRAVDAGKIRAVGLSNESAWGTTQWVRLADEMGLPRMASVQNEYSLLCRLFDTDMAETSINENVGLLSFSPLATGLLTRKYTENETPAGSRRSIENKLNGRITPQVWPAVRAYEAIADKHGLDITHLALAWCRTRPFMTSAIFGATKMDQLETTLKSVDVTLSQEVLNDIDQAHRAHPMPF